MNEVYTSFCDSVRKSNPKISKLFEVYPLIDFFEENVTDADSGLLNGH